MRGVTWVGWGLDDIFKADNQNLSNYIEGKWNDWLEDHKFYFKEGKCFKNI